MLKPLNITFPYTIWTDGAARGKHNGQGPSSAGFVVRDRDGNHVYSAAWALGPHTNNFAEYTALVKAAHWCLHNLQKDVQYVHFKSDSELMVRQIIGVYAVRSPEIRPLFDEAMDKLFMLQGYKIEHVRREFNRESDAWCNKVLDLEKETGVKFVDDNSRGSDTSRREDSVGGPGNDGPAEGAGVEGTSSAHSAGDPRLCIRRWEGEWVDGGRVEPFSVDFSYPVRTAVPEVSTVHGRECPVRVSEGAE